MIETVAFVLEQPALAGEPAAETGQRTVRTDDAVAGDDDADGIRAVGEPDRAHGFRPPDGPRQSTVVRGRAGRDLPQRAPDGALEFGAGRLDLDGVERSQLALEPGAERLPNLGRQAARHELHAVLAIMPTQQPARTAFIILEVERPHAFAFVADDEHVADRSRDGCLYQPHLFFVGMECRTTLPSSSY